MVRLGFLGVYFKLSHLVFTIQDLFLTATQKPYAVYAHGVRYGSLFETCLSILHCFGPELPTGRILPADASK